MYLPVVMLGDLDGFERFFVLISHGNIATEGIEKYGGQRT